MSTANFPSPFQVLAERRARQQQSRRYRVPLEEAVLERMSDVEDEPLSWLWPDHIAGDRISLLVGPAGVGKSLLALDMAARVTTGRPWPYQPPDESASRPGSVLLLAENDRAADTIRPRLSALGADLSRVVLLREMERFGPEPREVVPFSLEGTLPLLVESVRSVKDCRLLVIDPLSNYLPPGGRDRELFVANLDELACRENIAILIINRSAPILSRALANQSPSIRPFADAARAVWSLVPDRQASDRRLLLPVKNNLGPDDTGLAFRIFHSDKHQSASLEWETKSFDVSPNGQVAEDVETSTIDRPPSRLAAARVWLENELQEGERFAQELSMNARNDDISERTLQRAFRALGGIAKKGSTGVWQWRLPNKTPEQIQNDLASCRIGELAS